MFRQSFTVVFFFVTLVSGLFAYDLPLSIIQKNYQDLKMAEIRYKGSTLLRFFSQDASAYQRGAETIRCIKQMTVVGAKTKDIRYIHQGSQLIAKWGPYTVFSVTLLETAINNSTEKKLAAEWIKKCELVFRDCTESSYKKRGRRLVMAQIYPDLPSFSMIAPSLPAGTNCRLQNPKTLWTIVVSVVKDRDIPDRVSLGIDPLAASAIGITTDKEKIFIEEVDPLL